MLLISYLVILPLNLTVSSNQDLPFSSVFNNYLFCFISVRYRMYPKALYILGMCSTTEPHPQTLSMS